MKVIIKYSKKHKTVMYFLMDGENEIGQFESIGQAKAKERRIQFGLD